MSKKDKRKKGCPNINCSAHIDKRKYKADESYCSKCGTPLVFVCAECYKEIEDTFGHNLCMRCEAQEKHHGGKVKHALKNLGDKAKHNIAEKSKKAGNKVKEGAMIVKAKSPENLAEFKELAKNPKIQQVGAVVADAALDKLKNPKVRRLGKDIVKVIKK